MYLVWQKTTVLVSDYQNVYISKSKGTQNWKMEGQKINSPPHSIYIIIHFILLHLSHNKVLSKINDITLKFKIKKVSVNFVKRFFNIFYM